MAGSSNAFIGLPLATLTALQTAYVSALTALASNQSYSLNGRALTRANLADVKAALGEINAAIAYENGDTNSETLVSFTGR
jgi:hypothetical protein